MYGGHKEINGRCTFVTHDPSPGLQSSPEIDTTVSHSARVWDYWLGGKENYPVDREVGDRIAERFPEIVEHARMDRVFLGRSVRYMAGEAGIRQFLDIGTGLPTADNTHEVAQRVAPDSRIVYVDNDPLVLAHARALLTSTPEGATDYVDIDMHDPDKIIEAAARTLDFDRPVAVTMLGVLWHIVDDAEAQAVVDHYMDAVPSGSHLAIAHPTIEATGERMAEAIRQWNEFGKPPGIHRTPAQIAAFFDRLELVEPGVVSCTRWRPSRTNEAALGEPKEVDLFCAVGRKP
jgi:O-methyltransferase involved in polyketide biosynthesis